MALASSILLRTTRALQPAASSVREGQLCCITDEGLVIEQCVSSAWVQFSPGASGSLNPANHIFNPHFIRANRQAEGTLTTYSNTAARVYGPDRWAFTNENASIQFIRGNSGPTPETGLQSCFYGTVSKITSTGKIVLSQAMEQLLVCALRGQTVRVSMRMKASSAKTMRIALMQLAAAGTANVVPGYVNGTGPSGTFVSAFGANATDPTFGTNLAKIAPVSAINATIANTGLSCSVTTTWQRFSGTFTLPTDFKNLVLVVFTDSQFAAADSFSISEVGLYNGTAVRDWVDPSIGDINAQIFPYYFKTFVSGVAPAQSAGLTGAAFGTVSVAGANAQTMALQLSPPMRGGTYLTTLYNPSNADAFARNVTRATNATAAAATANAGSRQLEITFTGIAAWTIGDLVAIHATVDCEF